MSFKREGVDKSLLNVLRKRRVEELFAENIPNDEAQMLSNGKFTCTVCHYRPVFDTVQILAQHRHGKKHLENAKRAKVKLDELQELIEIRKQNQSLGNSSSTLPGISKAATSLLTKSPYDARVLKNRLKSHDRKPTINLQNSSTNLEPYLDSRAKIKDDQTNELAYKYWQLAGSGWKKNWSGKWEKDEQAEFDSDEEPPDLP
ncbi:unnamed protein product [Acanthosepion pharaonis]|uniref:Sodium channel modifier 1 n=1 Tax=Acanthosepion pharaonis TaxID=158019 RepID=A0A812CR82_ACAPH|nr:unnamed protein product [Sepia pharaonis]